jgi:hypothetical protein
MMSSVCRLILIDQLRLLRQRFSGLQASANTILEQEKLKIFLFDRTKVVDLEIIAFTSRAVEPGN